MSKLEVVVERDAMLSPDGLKAMIAQDKAARIAKAKTRIDVILAEERCQMLPVMILTPGNVTARIEIQAMD